jgi:prophage DNA circulation protein
MRASNSAFLEECEGLEKSNRRIADEMSEMTDEIQRLEDNVARLERSNEQWTNINQMYADQAAKYGPAMDELDEMAAAEKRKNSLIQRAMVRVLEKVEQSHQQGPLSEMKDSSATSSSSSLFNIALALAADAPWSQRYGEMPMLVLDLC